MAQKHSIKPLPLFAKKAPKRLRESEERLRFEERRGTKDPNSLASLPKWTCLNCGLQIFTPQPQLVAKCPSCNFYTKREVYT